MKLVDQHDPILRQKCELFNFDEPVVDPYELSDELQKIRGKGGGIGLAAPQVGINTQVLVIGMGDFKTEGAEDYNQVFFNPTIISMGDEKALYMMEGCLSYPGLFLKVKRPREHDNGMVYGRRVPDAKNDLHGITSRILQHEVDHLNGITFMKRAASYHLQKRHERIERYREDAGKRTQ